MPGASRKLFPHTFLQPVESPGPPPRTDRPAAPLAPSGCLCVPAGLRCCLGLNSRRQRPLPSVADAGLLFLQGISSKRARDPLLRAGFAAAYGPFLQQNNSKTPKRHRSDPQHRLLRTPTMWRISRRRRADRPPYRRLESTSPLPHGFSSPTTNRIVFLTDARGG